MLKCGLPNTQEKAMTINQTCFDADLVSLLKVLASNLKFLQDKERRLLVRQEKLIARQEALMLRKEALMRREEGGEGAYTFGGLPIN